MADLSYSEVAALLKYEPETGKLFWLPRPASMFTVQRVSAEIAAKRWNARFAGKEAITAVEGNGYRRGALLGKACRAHRVAWLLYTKEWPPEQIDHINGDTSDNRAVNLRPVSIAENARNQQRNSANTSGHTGVFYNPALGNWRANIVVRKRTIHLGSFPNFEEAVAARQDANIKYGFHPNHGRSPV